MFCSVVLDQSEELQLGGDLTENVSPVKFWKAVGLLGEHLECKEGVLTDAHVFVFSDMEKGGLHLQN
jgi:hypothetical protein